MKYEVTYTCGHQETIQVYGKASEREYTIANKEKQLCYECYKAKMQEDAKKDAAENALPELTGSEKQIIWATTIRAQALPILEHVTNTERAKLARLSGIVKMRDGAIIEKNIKNMEEMTEAIKNKTESSWWIDNRNKQGLELMRAVMWGQA